jgi:putative oxygen-independent coproporphyrinogen III oxidase
VFHVKHLARPLATEPNTAANAEISGAGFGLYLHWPFCEAKCPYCDFNSHVAGRVDQRRWASAFESEIARVAVTTAERELTSVFFGGGTPSLMQPETVERILSAVRRAWPCSAQLEVTLEANPSSVEAGRFRRFVDAGVNRFSIGVQALNDVDLRRLGRLHSAREAVAAVETARMCAERVSFDLIYARQDQSREAWRAELAQALAMGPDHLSLYQLTIEDGTAFGRRHRAGRLPGMPDADLSADLYETTQELCESAGLPAYEVSNHARPGRESRHNLIYWRGGDYIGLGPGAHGRLTLGGARFATHAELAPDAWLDGVETGRAQHEATERLSPEEQAAEYLMMGLRLHEGVAFSRLRALSGGTALSASLDNLLAEGLLWRTDDRFGTTSRGRMLLNGILRELL